MASKRRYLAKAVHAFHKNVDEQFTKGLERMDREVSCKRGCHHCCRVVVSMTLPEGVRVVDWILRNGRRKWFESKLPRIREQAEYLQRPDATMVGWFRERRERCVLLGDYVYESEAGESTFLEGGDPRRPVGRLCEVYPVRPFHCRTYVVFTDPELCAPENDSLPVETVNTQNAMVAYWQQHEAMGRDIAKLGAYYAPMPLVLLWAWTFCTKGPLALKAELKGTPFETTKSTNEFLAEFEARAARPTPQGKP